MDEVYRSNPPCLVPCRFCSNKNGKNILSADQYFEFSNVLIVLDLLLLRRDAFAHLVFNTRLKRRPIQVKIQTKIDRIFFPILDKKFPNFRQISQFQTKISQVQTKISQFQTKISQFQTKISQFQTKISQFQTTISQFQTKISQFQTKNPNFRQKFPKFRQNFPNFKQNFSKFRQNFPNSDKNFPNIDKNFTNLEKNFRHKFPILDMFFYQSKLLDRNFGFDW